MAKESDTVFIEFSSSEEIKNIQVNFGGKSASRKSVEELKFSYFYVFTKTDFWPELRESTDDYKRWDLSIKQKLPIKNFELFFNAKDAVRYSFFIFCYTRF